MSERKEGLIQSLQNQVRARRPESCSVYGTSPVLDFLLSPLGKNGIRGALNNIRNTSRHVLMMESDYETIHAYQIHWKDFKNSEVFLVLNHTSDFESSDSKVHLFVIADHAARHYWQNHPAKPDEKIAIFSHGPLLHAFLEQALCTNIFSHIQHIEYHLWPADQKFDAFADARNCASPDKIILHDPIDESVPAQINGYNRILLLCTPEENLKILKKLRAYCSNPTIFFYAPEPIQEATLLYSHLSFFGTFEKIFTPDALFREPLLESAKELNHYFQTHFNSLPWYALSPLSRRAALSVATYAPVLRRLFKVGVPSEILVELEHMRAMRFYRLHGESNHPSFLPYAQLPPEEKEKMFTVVKLAIGNRL